MSRLTLLSLQLLVAVVALALWQFLASVPMFGKVWLPPFFFSNPVDVGAQVVAWFANHRHGDRDGALIDDALARATVVELATRSFEPETAAGA